MIHTNAERAWLVAQSVKNLPAMRETQVRSLGREEPLEKGMATHSSILAWSIPWTEEPGGLQSTAMQSQTRLSNLARATWGSPWRFLGQAQPSLTCLALRHTRQLSHDGCELERQRRLLAGFI